MSGKVFANGLGVACKVSKGKTIAAFPDPCWSPPSPPAGPVVIPYANTAYTKHLSKGSKSVLIKEKPIAQKDKSFLKTSTGNEAATKAFGQGLISKKIKGKAYFASWSMNVMVEGHNVVRHTDLTTHNHGSASAQTGTQFHKGDKDTSKDRDSKCKYCDDPEHDFVDREGNNVGNSQELRKNIIDPISSHHWYTGGWSLQAHHLICSEAMSDDDWSVYCHNFGYNINHKKNGVMLPNKMALACQLHVPLHRGNHDLGVADGESYPRKIKNILDNIKKDIKKGDYCDNPKELIEELNDLSLYILDKIDKFEWTITADGKDYAKGGNGCAGVTGIPDKPKIACPENRKHNLKHEITNLPVLKSGSLQIGV